MRKFGSTIADVRLEIVTTTFVATGSPDGIHDLGRFLDVLNSDAIGRQIELRRPAVRPLYRAGAPLLLEAPLLVRRDDVVFATFDGPHFTRGASPRRTFDVPVLLLAPPFQIQGVYAVQEDADITQSLRFASRGFFVLKSTRAFDAEGAALGEGERVVVNGAAVQMMTATRQYISVVASVAPSVRREPAIMLEETAVVAEQTRAA